MELTDTIKQINSRIADLTTTKARLEGQQEQVEQNIIDLAGKLGIEVDTIDQTLVDRIKVRMVEEQTALEKQVDIVTETLDDIERLLQG